MRRAQNLFLELDRYLNVSLEELDTKTIKILKWHANNLKFIINGYSNRLYYIKQEISELKKKLESNLGIEIPENVVDTIRSLKGYKKEDRIAEFCNILKNKYDELISYELEELKNVDEKLRKIENKLLYETNPKRKMLLLKKKKELQKLKKLSDDPNKYKQFKMSLFDNLLKQNYALIDKFIGKIMELDYIENTIKLLEKKYELILNKLSKIYRSTKIDF